MKFIVLAALGCVALNLAGIAQTNIVDKASQLELNGRFKEAAIVLKQGLASPTIKTAERATLDFELDRLNRIKLDFCWTRDDLYRELGSVLKGLTPTEFDGWVKQGWFETREIDGGTYFADVAANNVFFRHPELYARQIPPPDNAEREHTRLEIVTAIKKAALAEGTPYVLPKTIEVHMKVSADPDVAASGDTVRAWIPIPRRYPFQTDFKILSSSSPPKSIDSEDSPIRSAYFEQTAVAGKPTDFKIEYQYTMRGVYFDLQPDKILPIDPNNAELKRFVSESPHVTFTPEIKALSAKIVGDEKNPMLKAKKIYEWLSDNMHYSYALEYSTIRDISDSCRRDGYGDCGQQGMLFITLCRYNGVPARWQSGWDLFPKNTSNHDWAEIYLAPYGWVPVDPYVGNYATRYITTLSQDEKMQIRNFYFGGIDQYRMAANSDHNATLNPPKNSARMDTVDFQRGELEHNGTNIYLDHFSYRLTYKVVASASLP